MDGITLALALLGAALGVVNTLWVLFRDTVRIRVVPVWMTGGGTVAGTRTEQDFVRYSDNELSVAEVPNGQIGLRIINTGFTEITISSVGWCRSPWPKRHFKRWRLLSHILADAVENTVLPARLAPRSAITVWALGRGAAVDGALAGKFTGYARTECGLTVFGTNGVLRAALARARANA